MELIQHLPCEILTIIFDYTIFKPKSNQELNNAVKEWCTNKEKALQKYGDIGTWDTSLITDMSFLFSYDYVGTFNEDISNWDVSNVRSMMSMFYGCSDFNKPLNNWDVSNVRDMSFMFYGCKSFNQPLGKWDISNVRCISSMFKGCESFNQPLNHWTFKIEWCPLGCQQVINGCHSLEEKNIFSIQPI